MTNESCEDDLSFLHFANELIAQEMQESPQFKKPVTKKEIVATYDNLQEKPLMANKQIADAVKRLREVKGMQSFLKKISDEIEEEIAVYMQDYEKLITEDGEDLMSWSFNNDSNVFDEKRFMFDNEELYKQYVTTKKGNRVMRLIERKK